jgi:protein-disulfide isomerase
MSSSLPHPLSQPTERLAEPINEKDHVLGAPTAPVTLVEYGDYECPDCLNTQPIIAELRKRHGDRLRFVFRHFPRNSVHPHASAAASAAEAAGEQDKFWEMHETLFKHQKEFGDIDLSHLALRLGLEIYKFEASLGQDLHRRRIAADYEGGIRSGVKGTPTFFINGIRYRGKIAVEELAAAIDSAGK